ncbi:MAG: hypothetical protein WC584_03055 [Candidatus Pacearchaeota archaeon]
MKKIGGYIFVLLGLIVLASGIKGFEIILKFLPFLSGINKTYSMIAGLVLVVVGIILLMSSGRRSGKQLEEVPIYRGKNIVGYRRNR